MEINTCEFPTMAKAIKVTSDRHFFIYLLLDFINREIDVPTLFWDPLLKTTALAYLNRLGEAGKNLKLLQQLTPVTGNQVKNIIGSFILAPQLITEIMEDLRMAGLQND